MSLRCDTVSLIPGALVCGDRGLGVLGSDVPSSGDNGAGYLYNDLSLPADANKEVCGRITTWPSAGTLYAYEDSSFTFTGASDGSYAFAYQLYVDGMATGSPATVVLNVGQIALSGAALSVGTATGSLSTAITLSGSAASISTAGGSLAAQIALTGSAIAQAAADGTLDTAIQMLGTASAQSGASGDLSTASSGLEGHSQASASASASLTTQIVLNADAAAQASAWGDLTATAVMTLTAADLSAIDALISAQLANFFATPPSWVVPLRRWDGSQWV